MRTGFLERPVQDSSGIVRPVTGSWKSSYRVHIPRQEKYSPVNMAVGGAMSIAIKNVEYRTRSGSMVHGCYPVHTQCQNVDGGN